MKLFLVLCFGLIALQRADAFWHHKFDYLWDWDDEVTEADCLKYVREIALLIRKKVSINELNQLDQEKLKCIAYYNLLGYFFNDKETSNPNPMDALPGMTNTANSAPVGLAQLPASAAAAPVGLAQLPASAASTPVQINQDQIAEAVTKALQEYLKNQGLLGLSSTTAQVAGTPGNATKP